ncbi:hypothetical protein [Roseateles chitinivorans]|uniref:hypothetical protein n=1 Tax=Roseateles chitinivorans TaxID=2917965 RepID=UPI003D66FBCE
MFDSLVPKEESKFAQDVVAKAVARDFAAIDAVMDAEHRPADLQAALEKMLTVVPAGTPKSVKVVGINTMRRPSSTTYNLTYEYEYPSGWLMAAVLLERRDDKLLLQGIQFVPRTRSLEAENSFGLAGKGPLHYVVLLLAVAIPLFIIYALVLCFRTRFPRRKWLWMLFVALGLVTFRFDWASGAWDFQLVSFLLLGAGATKSGPVAPWVMSLAVPVGAIVFLLRRQSLQRVPAEIAAVQQPPQRPQQPQQMEPPPQG